MPSTMEMSPVQIAARVAVLWEEREGGAGDDLWEQLLSGSLDPERGALSPGESWQTIFEERGISLFQSVFGGITQAHTGQGGYPLIDQLLANATVSSQNPTDPGAETLMSSIAHILTDIRAVLGDGDTALVDIGVSPALTPYRRIDLTRPSTIRDRLLPRPLTNPGPRSIANSIGQLADAISALDERLETAVTEIRIALGDSADSSITSPVAFSPALPWDTENGTSEDATVATAFRDVHRDRLDRTDDRIARLEQRIRDLESAT